jgi:hypothetical protein
VLEVQPPMFSFSRLSLKIVEGNLVRLFFVSIESPFYRINFSFDFMRSFWEFWSWVIIFDRTAMRTPPQTSPPNYYSSGFSSGS